MSGTNYVGPRCPRCDDLMEYHFKAGVYAWEPTPAPCLCGCMYVLEQEQAAAHVETDEWDGSDL